MGQQPEHTQGDKINPLLHWLILMIEDEEWCFLKRTFRSWWSTDGWTIATLSSTWGQRSVSFETIKHQNFDYMLSWQTLDSMQLLWTYQVCPSEPLITVTIPERFIYSIVCSSKYIFYWPLSSWNIRLFPYHRSDSQLIVVICTRNGTKWLLPPRTPMLWSRTGFVTIISTMNLKMF